MKKKQKDLHIQIKEKRKEQESIEDISENIIITSSIQEQSSQKGNEENLEELNADIISLGNGHLEADLNFTESTPFIKDISWGFQNVEKYQNLNSEDSLRMGKIFSQLHGTEYYDQYITFLTDEKRLVVHSSEKDFNILTENQQRQKGLTKTHTIGGVTLSYKQEELLNEGKLVKVNDIITRSGNKENAWVQKDDKGEIKTFKLKGNNQVNQKTNIKL